jgi:hypothetical protein
MNTYSEAQMTGVHTLLEADDISLNIISFLPGLEVCFGSCNTATCGLREGDQAKLENPAHLTIIFEYPNVCHNSATHV